MLAGAPGKTRNLRIASRISKENMGTKPECVLPMSNGGTGAVIGTGSNNYVSSPSKPSLNLDPPRSGTSAVSSGLLGLIMMLF